MRVDYYLCDDKDLVNDVCYVESANWSPCFTVCLVLLFLSDSKLILFIKSLSRIYICTTPNEFCFSEYRCDGISNLLTSPYCHTACTLLSVSIVEGRPLDFRVEQTVDLNADYRLPIPLPGHAAGHANFREPAAQPDMQIHRKKGTTDMCDCSTRFETHYDLWIIIAPDIFFPLIRIQFTLFSYFKIIQSYWFTVIY